MTCRRYRRMGLHQSLLKKLIWWRRYCSGGGDGDDGDWDDCGGDVNDGDVDDGDVDGGCSYRDVYGVDGDPTSLEVAPQAREKTQQTPKEDAQEPLDNNLYEEDLSKKVSQRSSYRKWSQKSSSKKMMHRSPLITISIRRYPKLIRLLIPSW